MTGFTQELNVEKSEQLKAELGVDIYSELTSASEIVNNFRDKFGNKNPEKLEKIIKEYEEARLKAIEIFKLDREITKNDLNNLLIEIHDVMAVKETYMFNPDDYLVSMSYTNSKGKEYIEKSLKGNISEGKIDRLENDANKFLDSNLSLSDLSAKQVSWLLSGIQILGSDYRNKLVTKLSNDTEGLLFLEENWEKGYKISEKNQIGGLEFKNLADDIIYSASYAIENEIIKILTKQNPELDEDIINLEASRISEDINDARQNGNPEDVFIILKRVILVKEDLFNLGTNVSKLNNLKTSVELSDLEKKKENLENKGKISVEGEMLISGSVNEEIANSTYILEINDAINEKKEKIKETEKLNNTLDKVKDLVDTDKVGNDVKNKLYSKFVDDISSGNKSLEDTVKDFAFEAKKLGYDDIFNSISDFYKTDLSKNSSESNINNSGKIEEKTGLASLEVGETFSYNYKGSEASIKKNSEGFYELKLGDNIEICETETEVNNVLETREFISSLGLDFLFGNINNIMQRVDDYAGLNVQFNAKDGINEDEKFAFVSIICHLLKGVDGNKTAFDSFKIGSDFSEVKEFFDMQNDNGLGIRFIAEESGILNNGELELALIDDKLKKYGSVS